MTYFISRENGKYCLYNGQDIPVKVKIDDKEFEAVRLDEAGLISVFIALHGAIPIPKSEYERHPSRIELGIKSGLSAKDARLISRRSRHWSPIINSLEAMIRERDNLAIQDIRKAQLLAKIHEDTAGFGIK
jgi:hypothetical protein